MRLDQIYKIVSNKITDLSNRVDRYKKLGIEVNNSIEDLKLFEAIQEHTQRYFKKNNDMNIPEPTSQRTEVIYMLLTRKSIDKRVMMLTSDIYNLGDIILKLRRDFNLKIETKRIKVMNKYNREVSHSIYSLQNKKEAKEIYLNLINQTK